MQLKHLLAVVLLGVGLGLTPAFTPTLRADDTPKERPAHSQNVQIRFLLRLQAAVNKVDPTSDQKSKLDPAFADARAKIDAAIKDAGEDKDSVDVKAKPIIKELGDVILAVLTPEQKEKFAKIRGETGARRPH